MRRRKFKNTDKLEIDTETIYSSEEARMQMIALARSHDFKRKKNSTVLTDLNYSGYKKLKRIRNSLSSVSTSIISLIPAARWLFDNFYLLLREIKKNQGSSFTPPNIPVLTSGRYKQFPRIYAIAKEMIVMTGGRLDEDKIMEMLNFYQSVAPLTSIEIWYFNEVLGQCILESVVDIADNILKVTNTKSLADEFVNQAMEYERSDQKEKKEFKIPLKYVSNTVYLSHVFYCLRKQSLDEVKINKYMDKWIDFEHKLFLTKETFSEERKFEVRLESVIRSLIVSLRAINEISMDELFDQISLVESVLSLDPAGTYRNMSFETRDQYRRVIESYSIKYNKCEWDIAATVVEIARQNKANKLINKAGHVGTYLVTDNNKLLRMTLSGKTDFAHKETKNTLKGKGYFVSVVLMTVAIYALLITNLAFFNCCLSSPLVVAFLIVAFAPILGMAIEFSNLIFTRLIASVQLPMMDYEDGIPDEFRTFVVMPVIVSNAAKAIEYVKRLEKHYAVNRQSNLYFALLLDLNDADSYQCDHDSSIIDEAEKAVVELNKKYPQVHQLFSLFVRNRKWNEKEQCYMGWERKRGKLEEFNALLCGEKNSDFIMKVGDQELLQTFKYVITLDADTDLIMGSGAKFVGTMAHPLNQPILDEKTSQIKYGYAIVQSEVRNHIIPKKLGVFTRIFSGDTGLDGYSTVISDVYQDTFNSGTFVGKGIYDVKVMHQLLRGKIPENAVLSHDLLESSFVRCAFSSAVTLMDRYPSSVYSFMRREHRWIRGDWQIIGWVFKKSPITFLSRWKMFDNLRRSVVPASMIILLILDIFMQSKLFWVWFVIVFFNDILRVIVSLFDLAVQKILNNNGVILFSQVFQNVHNIIGQAFFTFVLLPYRATNALDAIIRTLYRLLISKKKLLEWQTADAIDNSKLSVPNNYLAMWQIFIPITIMFVGLIFNPQASYLYYLMFVVAVLWMISPMMAYAISYSKVKEKTDVLKKTDDDMLRETARRTWQFFSDMYTEENHYLCPDNYQVSPNNTVSDKTSPTNIGLQLLSTLSAYDFGYITLLELLHHLEKTIDTIKILPKWNGHLYNWYNIQTLEVLNPQYVSTVDNGNYLGYLITLKNGLQLIKESPIYNEHSIRGINVLAKINGLERPFGNQFNTISEFMFSLQEYYNENSRIDKFDTNFSLKKSIEALLEEGKFFGSLDYRYDNQPLLSDLVKEQNINARLVVNRIERLISNLDEQINGTHFKELFDFKRKLFYIGYHASSQTVDAGHYDLMASECSLTSYISVARGEVPKKHWKKLSRPVTMIKGRPAFVSWSGTMFEYLMPGLVLKQRVGSVFDDSAKAAVKEQQLYAKKNKIPFGISESQYFSFDINSNYQYKAFGVPKLQLQPRISSIQVVSPYSSALAINVSPKKSIANLRLLKEMDAVGEYGYFESLDFSSPDSYNLREYSVVKSFMAHHQGMILVALNNFYHQDIMQNRFHKEPMIKAAEPLLEEVRQQSVISVVGKNYIVQNKDVEFLETNLQNRVVSEVSPKLPSAHWLSNANYSMMVTSDGDGFSKYNNIFVNKWRPDTSVSSGMYIYLRNLENDDYWSTTYQPTLVEPDDYEVVFSHHQAEFNRVDKNITTKSFVTLAANDNYELRKVIVTNNSNKTINLELTSYVESVLDTYLNELYHPAFNKLFLESEFVKEHDMLICKRRKHANMKDRPYLFHMVKADHAIDHQTQYETDRLKFIGRNNTVRTPDAILDTFPLGSNAGFSLDPIMSLRKKIRVAPGKSESVTYITGISLSVEEAKKISEKLSVKSGIEEEFNRFKLNSELEIKYLSINDRLVNAFQDLVGPLFYPSEYYRGPKEAIENNWKNQSFLWRFGVSGDNPMMLLTVETTEEISLIRDALKAYEYYQINLLKVDLLILIRGEEGYQQDLSAMLAEMTSALKVYDEDEGKPSLFILYESRMSPEEVNLLFTVATIVFNDENGIYLKKKVDHLLPDTNREAIKPTTVRKEKCSNRIRTDDLQFFNGFGGFNESGDEYVIILDDESKTPMPWINVISNDSFGFHVSENGSGYTWAVNSHENKITPWSNDPVIDPVSEAVHIYEKKTNSITSPARLSKRFSGCYRVRHGYGYSFFEHKENGICHSMQLLVSLDEPVRLWNINLKNETDEEKTLFVSLYCEWVLGMNRALTAPYVVTNFKEKDQILTAKGIYNYEYRKHRAFMFSSEEIVSYTGDKQEFIGVNGEVSMPLGLKSGLTGKVGAALDPCGVIGVEVTIKPHEDKQIIFGLGQTEDRDLMKSLCNKYRDINNVNNEVKRIKDYWTNLLGQMVVKTNDNSLNIMVNGWLLYQTLSCRIKARAAFYQCGGAYGYRDQLQDVLSLIDTDPERVRKQILIACSRQFKEGDVQHWWHPPVGLGVRTKIKDDLLWLPYVTATYINHTGDYSVLEEVVPCITGPLPSKDQHDIMFIPEESDEEITVYEHCLRTIDFTQFGVHGLPLMGGGDWNDGMNMVGIEGKGESVWLGWFVYAVLKAFKPMCDYQQDSEKADEYEQLATILQANLEKNAWDGEWYSRAFYDNGDKMGAKESDECRIDSISQSWSVISGGASKARRYQALYSAKRYLVKPENNLSLLLTPPFNATRNNPGYIKDYYPGIRENGGQYTHAACWLAIANTLIKDTETSYELLKMLNPINSTSSKMSAMNYEKEPYVVVADVSMNDMFAGRGGWSWYTGSAGWLYQAYTKYFLGIKRHGSKMEIDPSTPPEFGDYEVTYRFKDTIYNITVIASNNPDALVSTVEVDGTVIEGNAFELVNDSKEHHVVASKGS